ncbi:helix-turn-helix domain-containing protein [Streptomyces sp. NPDC050617]|uniref:ArsR family transcriptional regulator n=1 Tax=Streptomyces sp. NPDC050617 TaxID=3154628 RepID=UPI003423F44B
MVRIRFTVADFARVRFAPRPAPLQELNAALSMMVRRDGQLLFGHWRQRALRNLPSAALPLRDLVPGAVAPQFIDVFSDTLAEGLETVRAARPALVRSEMERVYALQPTPAPPWVRGLHRGDGDSWRVLRRAQLAAFDAVLRPAWDLVEDLHRAEFTRHALAVAEHGIGAALTALVPGGRLGDDGVWEFAGPSERDIRLDGRGLVLVPTFHWTGRPLIADLPGRPLYVTYPVGDGLPPALLGAADPAGSEEALAGVVGRTRLDVLLVLADEHTTTGLARRLHVSNATASAHAAALRGAGLITTVRAGRSVLHRRTALGSLLVRGRGRGRAPAPYRSTGATGA